MDPIELQLTLYKALAHAEHSIDRALLLAHTAAEELANSRLLYQEILDEIEAYEAQSKGNPQSSSLQNLPDEVNEVSDVKGDHDRLVSTADEPTGLQTATATAHSHNIGGESSYGRETIASHQSQFDALQGTCLRQTAQIAINNAEIASKNVEIAFKDLEIVTLQNKLDEETSKPKGVVTADPPASTLNQSRKMTEIKMNPKTPSFMPSRSNSHQRDAAFKNFTDKITKTRVPMSAVPAKEPEDMAGRSDTITHNDNLPKGSTKSEDLIDLSTDKSPPPKEVKKQTKHIASDPAAFLAAASVAFAKFDTRSYGPRSNVTSTAREEHVLHTDKGDVTIDTPSIILSPPLPVRTLVDRTNRQTAMAPPPTTTATAVGYGSVRHSIFTRAYQRMPPGMNPHNDEAVKNYVRRPNCRGYWVELPLEWIPVANKKVPGRIHYVLKDTRA